MADNPTGKVCLDFKQYLEVREKEYYKHLNMGVPDYAFSLDLTLKQQLMRIPGMTMFCKTLTKWMVPFFRQQMTMSCVAVGPNQFPHIHAIGEQCARRLGIGIPQIFVKYDPTINAYTYATEDSTPIIIIHSALIDRYTDEELATIIGHECGHIHNNHGIYMMAGQLLANTGLFLGAEMFPGLIQIIKILSFGAQLLLMRWSRCAEVTSDRAGLICSPDIKTALMAEAKLGFGGIANLENINIEEYVRQVESIKETPVRFLELNSDHPLVPKRIEALRIFSQCDTFLNWRPDLKQHGALSITKQEADNRCEPIISVISGKR